MTRKLFITIALMIATLNFFSQTNNANHPTINNLVVAYKSVPQGTNTIGIADLKCIPNASITLKPSANATKIYFKMINAQTNAVVYQVNYVLNASPIINTDGVKLFENANGVISISSGQAVSLRPYIYQLQTEDSQNTLTVLYSVTK